MQHSGSGAALGRARDAGRGLPAPTPSPAFDINNTNSSSPGPRGQAKGPTAREQTKMRGVSVLLAAAVGAAATTSPQQQTLMNGGPYLLSNSKGFKADFTTYPSPPSNQVRYFDAYSPLIRTQYSQVYW